MNHVIERPAALLPPHAVPQPAVTPRSQSLRAPASLLVPDARPAMPVEGWFAALGQPLREAGPDAPRASGTLEAHYAPRAKLRLMPADQLRVALRVLAKSSVNPVAVYCRTVTPGRAVRAARSMPDDPAAAAHVHEDFGDDFTIVDGGECDAGIESAIVDCSRGAPALLRPGVLTRGQLEAVLGEPLRDAGADAPRASGTLQAHYAPRAKLRLMAAAQLRAALGVLAQSGTSPVAVYFRTVTPGRTVHAYRAMPDDPIAAAHELFSALRELDASGASLIWVEAPPDAPAWEGVRDRLQRAAAA